MVRFVGDTWIIGSKSYDDVTSIRNRNGVFYRRPIKSLLHETLLVQVLDVVPGLVGGRKKPHRNNVELKSVQVNWMIRCSW